MTNTQVRDTSSVTTRLRRPLLVDAAVAACILAARVASADQATGTSAGESAGAGGTLAEVTVPAERGVENLQEVPTTIRALTADTLTQLNGETFSDVLKYLPNVNSASRGPGQGEVIMRGLGTVTGSIQGAGVVGSFPNVAIYLDDQSGQLPGRNLDIYSVDLERIEVLEGPQGTLFGSGAQAGVLRYITNKPKLDVTEGAANASYGVTAHGDPNSSRNLTLNVPLIEDALAVRGVIYEDRRGG